MKHDDNVFLHLADFSYKSVLIFWQSHVLSVKALGLKAVGKTGEYNRRIAVRGKRNGFFNKSVVCFIRSTVESARILNPRIVLNAVENSADLVRSYMRASAALITRFFGKFSYKYGGFLLVKRQNGIIILKKNRSIERDFLRSFMMNGSVELETLSVLFEFKYGV